MPRRTRTSLADAVRTVRATRRRLSIICPLHDDQNPSLSVWLARDGWVNFKCMAGCDAQAIAVAEGVTDAERAPPEARNGPPPSLDITYDYTDAAGGKLLYQVVRRPDKTFRQRRPNPDPASRDEWLWNLADTPRVLYRLPRVVAAVAAGTPLWIVEGEKDVAACEAQGLTATTNPGGAGKWRTEYSRTLGGADVTIVADKDAAGRKHAEQVCRSLIAVGVRAWRIVEAAGDAKDAADHFAAGGTPDTFVLVKGQAAPAPAPPPPVDELLRFTEGGDADRFIALHGENLRYVAETDTWYLWDGVRFAPERRGQVRRLARDVVRELVEQLRDAALDRGRVRQLTEQIKKANAKHGQQALLWLAQSHVTVARALEDFDTRQDLLAVQNGVVDLRTGLLGAASKAYEQTQCAATSYERGALAPRWEEHLWWMFKGRTELIDYVQKAVGYSLTGDTTEQCLFILYGGGWNGKSKFLEAVLGMLGDYGHTANISTVLLAKEESGDRPRSDVVDLRGRRFVTASEITEGKRLNEALVKSMTGGEQLNARPLRQRAVVFQPTHKLWLGLNHLPIIQGEDEAIWRRIRVIPCDAKIAEADADRRLGDKLRAEWPGILAWAVQGALAWRRAGLGEPPAEVRAATMSYREESSTLVAFLEEMCFVEPNAEVEAGVLYAAYRQWAQESGVLRPMPKQGFGTKLLAVLGARGRRDRRTAGWYYTGLSVRREQRAKLAQRDTMFDVRPE